MSLAAPIADAVLITGAGRRVGLHLAERMLDRQRPVIAHFHAETEGVEVLRRRGALCVAADLATESGTRELIRAVRRLYPGLPAHPGHRIAVHQMRDCGGMVSLLLESEEEAVAHGAEVVGSELVGLMPAGAAAAAAGALLRIDGFDESHVLELRLVP